MKEASQKQSVPAQRQSSAPSSAPATGQLAEILESPRMVMQRKSVAGASGGVAPPAGGGGTGAGSNGLPTRLTRGIAALSGMDVSDVKVHRNSPKPAQAGALAFAQNNEIHLAPGKEKHLPHEAWHIVQQRQGRVRATLQEKGNDINDAPGLEQEATVMGNLAMAMPAMGVVARPVAAAPVLNGPMQRVPPEGEEDTKKSTSDEEKKEETALPPIKPKIVLRQSHKVKESGGKDADAPYQGADHTTTDKLEKTQYGKKFRPNNWGKANLNQVIALGREQVANGSAQKPSGAKRRPQGSHLQPMMQVEPQDQFEQQEPTNEEDVGTQSVFKRTFKKKIGLVRTVRGMMLKMQQQKAEPEGTRQKNYQRVGDRRMGIASDKDGPLDDPEQIRALIENECKGLEIDAKIYHRRFTNENVIKRDFVRPAVHRDLFPLLSAKVFINAQKKAGTTPAMNYSKTRTNGLLLKSAKTALQNELAADSKTESTATGPAAKEWRRFQNEGLAKKKDQAQILMQISDETAKELGRRAVAEKLIDDDKDDDGDSAAHKPEPVSDHAWQIGKPKFLGIMKAEISRMELSPQQMSAAAKVMLDHVRSESTTDDVSALKELLSSVSSYRNEMTDKFIELGATVNKGVIKVVTEDLRKELKYFARKKYNLGGWTMGDGSRQDQDEIVDRTAELAANQYARDDASSTSATKVVEANLSTFSKKLGKKLDTLVEKPGDYTTLQVAVRIPVAPLVWITLEFRGDISRTNQGVKLGAHAAVGATFGLPEWFDVGATFGGFVEAHGVNATHALELMSYSFYERAKGKLSPEWLDSIWGISESEGSGDAWRAYVVEKMTDRHYVESGVKGEVKGGASIGFADVSGGAGAATSTSWRKHDGTVGADEKLVGYVQAAGSFGPLKGNVMAKLTKTTEEDQDPAWNFTMAGSTSISKGPFGGGVTALMDGIIAVLSYCDNALAKRYAKKDPEQQEATKDASGLSALLKNLLLIGGLQTGKNAWNASSEKNEAQENQEKKKEEKEEPIDVISEGMQNEFQSTNEAMSQPGKQLGYAARKYETTEKPVELLHTGINGAIPKEFADKIKFGGRIGVDFQFSRTTRWTGDIFLKDGMDISVDLIVLKIAATGGHKFSLSENAVLKHLLASP